MVTICLDLDDFFRCMKHGPFGQGRRDQPFTVFFGTSMSLSVINIQIQRNMQQEYEVVFPGETV